MRKKESMVENEGAVEVVIEIERHSNRKFEYREETGTMELDRILPYPFFYPYSYGFIPQTLSEDGDAVDILVISEESYPTGSRLLCRIVGVLEMEDEKGRDEKLLVVPETDSSVKDIKDIGPSSLEDIKWFFTHYKSRDQGRWSRVEDFHDRERAMVLYGEARTRYSFP